MAAVLLYDAPLRLSTELEPLEIPGGDKDAVRAFAYPLLIDDAVELLTDAFLADGVKIGLDLVWIPTSSRVS